MTTSRGGALGLRLAIEDKRPAWAPRFLDLTMRTSFSSKKMSASEFLRSEFRDLDRILIRITNVNRTDHDWLGA
jgi:hypothetical protein